MPIDLRPFPPEHPDAATLVGVRPDGAQDVLATIRMTPRMKAREIVRSYFGEPDDEGMNDAAMALVAREELIAWMQWPPPAAGGSTSTAAPPAGGREQQHG
ncbi:hypothetical protein [Ramlibacter sp. AN1133]|uniref:hypothetical protein n=1 Tax=Ramlibacter sp. AN1133 TaxID=3133429 RepID=UPI0030BC934F